MKQTQLAPGLLLSMPQLVDPNFTRAVVLMIEHNDEGSFGLIINQPTATTASKIMQDLKMTWNGDEQTLVWSGGPVMQDIGWILHEPVDSVPAESAGIGMAGTILVTPELALSSSKDALRILAEAPPSQMRVLVGYAGWGPGQLASEMARGSWLHADLDLDIVFHTPAEDMWDHSLRSLGIDPQTIVQGFGVH